MFGSLSHESLFRKVEGIKQDAFEYWTPLIESEEPPKRRRVFDSVDDSEYIGNGGDDAVENWVDDNVEDMAMGDINIHEHAGGGDENCLHAIGEDLVMDNVEFNEGDEAYF